MRKLAAVEEAKVLFAEAREWGVWRWLSEKSRVRKTADAAWEALDACESELRASWSADLRRAAKADAGLKQADAESRQLRLDAEAQFDEADRRMSISMAAEGTGMAIDAWESRERFIRKLEAFARKSADA